LVIAGFYGTSVDEVTEDLITEAKLGGLIFFGRNVESTSQLVDLLNTFKRIETKIPLFLSIDEEGGSVSRLPSDIANLPGARTIMKKNVLNLTYEEGRAIGYALDEYGFNMNFAPVLDVDNGKSNSVIGSRSFSTDPMVVAELGVLMARGMEEHGVIPVVKHFPGHGDTAVDSHAGTPIVKHPMDRLNNVELYPFAYAIERDIPAIMVGHIILSKVDAKVPSTLSYAVMTGLLRNQMKFEGVVVTDDLGMGAISADHTQAEAAVLSIKAGADIVMISHGRRDPFKAVAALKKAVLDGVIPMAMLDQKVRRILRLKLRFKIDQTPHDQVDVGKINEWFNELRKK
ncbi:MAG: beta-N-acetylhexosaminidase, partial [Erysipelotrichaceae bacterium]|nr:beta-N-acetylhexosaminidase [Erysipelotrichaceae bacterium]